MRALNENGTAIVVLSRTSLVNSGKDLSADRERMIRGAVLRAGLVEAIIALPPRMRRDSSAQLVVWIVRHPSRRSEQDSPVLFVDASNLGTKGKVDTTLEEEDVRAVATALQTWRRSGSVVHDPRVPTVAVRPSQMVDSDMWRPFAEAGIALRPTREQLFMKIRSMRIEVADALEVSSASTERLMNQLRGGQ